MDLKRKRDNPDRRNGRDPKNPKDKGGKHKKKRSELNLLTSADVDLCLHYNLSTCNSASTKPGEKCKKGVKKYLHACAARRDKSNPNSEACSKLHSAQEHK